MRVILLIATGLLANMAFAQCDAMFEHELRKLHSKETVNLCDRYGGQPVIVVNTASHCGFTPQFKSLEALYQQQKANGLKIAGFPSNDFRQEAGSEEKTADVCYVNYGVTFDMYSPQHVRGDAAHPLFAALAEKAGEPPRWNFHKYLVNRDGQVVASFSSGVSPADEKFRQAVAALLAEN